MADERPPLRRRNDDHVRGSIDTYRSTRFIRRPHEDVRLRLGQVMVEVLSGPDRGKRFAVEQPVVTGGRRGRARIDPADAGRFEPHAIMLTDDTVSATHFELTLVDNMVRIRDLNSTNGTWILGPDGKKAVIVGPDRISLTPDAHVQVGEVRLRFVSAQAIEVPASNESKYGELLGVSPAMRELFAHLDRLATMDINVVLVGETGTGKELAARAIHDHSDRKNGPFAILDCGWLPTGDMAAGSIFGHRRGAFTGATSDVASVFEQAHGGTLFIDEIGELPLALQPKLLRALQEGQVRRLGETIMRTVDVRVIAATHRDLVGMVAEDRFRADLYYRLTHATVFLPPLRDRPDDIVFLAQHFLATQRGGKHTALRIATDAELALRSHPWNGNVRELQNAMRVAGQRASESEVTARDLTLEVGPPTGARGRLSDEELPDPELFDLPLETMVDQVTVRYLEQIGGRYDWNLKEMARHAGYSRKDALLRVLDKLGIQPPALERGRGRR